MKVWESSCSLIPLSSYSRVALSPANGLHTLQASAAPLATTGQPDSPNKATPTTTLPQQPSSAPLPPRRAAPVDETLLSSRSPRPTCEPNN